MYRDATPRGGSKRAVGQPRRRRRPLLPQQASRGDDPLRPGGAEGDVRSQRFRRRRTYPGAGGGSAEARAAGDAPLARGCLLRRRLQQHHCGSLPDGAARVSAGGVRAADASAVLRIGSRRPPLLLLPQAGGGCEDRPRPVYRALAAPLPPVHSGGDYQQRVPAGDCHGHQVDPHHHVPREPDRGGSHAVVLDRRAGERCLRVVQRKPSPEDAPLPGGAEL
mmetsp:Transcript_45448/g.103491  ORF Transcript_45448/g.103491 Transcript_45448/m.103491 type:complete len:221 (+) Transcript_45448:800-1462(+)